MKYAPTAVALLAIAACQQDLTAPASPTFLRPVFATAPPEATELEAVEIDRYIHEKHWPWYHTLPARYVSGDSTSPDYNTLGVSGWTASADAAIWNGHYLASQAFRYAVTGSAEALANAQRALDGLQVLVDVTGTDLLARWTVPMSAPQADTILNEEKSRHGVWYNETFRGERHGWLGNTSRDQYSGVFFGLGVAYDLIPDDLMRAQIRGIVNRHLQFLEKNGWNVTMPDGTISTSFFGRSDQRLSFLQVGRRVDPLKWEKPYTSYRSRNSKYVVNPIKSECTDPHGSYFKFNLDHINLYNLIRLEEAGTHRNNYLKAFDVLRGSSCTGTHQNAHFSLIERGIRGPSSTRDAATREYLGLWLTRLRRDHFLDNSAEYPPDCGDNRSCTVIPVDRRPTTDFLWQRSPYTVKGGKLGTIEWSGIDYVLPYWMARYYGVLSS